MSSEATVEHTPGAMKAARILVEQGAHDVDHVAALIDTATAVPELLGAAKTVSATFTGGSNKGHNSAISRLRAAIAKAECGSP